MSDPLPSLDQALYGNAPNPDVQKLGPTPDHPQLKPEFREPSAPSAPTPAPAKTPAASPQAPSPAVSKPATIEARPTPPTATQPPAVGEGPVTTLPEGMQADPALVAEFGEVAKELRMDKAGADRMMALHSKALEAQVAAHNQARATWEATTRRDFGSELPAVVQEIRGAAGNDADAQRFFELMAWSGLGSEPAVLRVLRRMARGY